MKPVKSQNAMEAMNFYQSRKAAGQQVKVSSSGAIREVRLFDRIAESFRSLKPGHKPVDWEAAAKEQIKSKFTADIKLFVPKISAEDKNSLDGLIDQIFRLDSTDANDLLFKLGMGSKSTDLKTALTKVRDMHNKVTPKDAGYVRPLLEKNSGNLDKAIEVTALAKNLQKKMGLNAGTALTTAYRIDMLMQRDPGLKQEQALEILLFSGSLVNNNICSSDVKPDTYIYTGGFEKSEAVQFALDIWDVLKKTNFSFDDLMRLADQMAAAKQIPSGLSGKTRISAALCFLQLKEKGDSDEQALNIINKRLARRTNIEAQLPHGCKKECIHNSAHIRASYALDDAQLKSFQSCTETLSTYPLCTAPITKKVEGFSSLEHQFGLDATRSNYQVLHAGIPATRFEELEAIKKKADDNVSASDLSAWLNEFNAFAGSTTAASTLSRFVSQTIFGDVQRMTGEISQTASGLNIQAVGEIGTNYVQFQMNRIKDEGQQKTRVIASTMTNGLMLQGSELPKEEIELSAAPLGFSLPLIPNAGEGKKANINATSARYDAVFDLTEKDLKDGKVTCTPREVRVTYDFIFNEYALDDMYTDHDEP
jgi:hypothetical protein